MDEAAVPPQNYERERRAPLQAPSGASEFVSQMKALLGEDGEFEARCLEESWASGMPLNEASFGRKSDSPATDVDSVRFAEWNNLGGLLFSVLDCPVDGPVRGHRVAFETQYRTGWLNECSEDLAAHVEETAARASKTLRDASAYSARASQPAAYRRACELLGLSQDSTAAQIKAGYRQMASQWHPDRLQQRAPGVRALATRRMAAINEAYAMLRSFVPTAAC